MAKSATRRSARSAISISACCASSRPSSSAAVSPPRSTLGLSRSAISLHMGDLKRLGMRLCQRGRAGFAPDRRGPRGLSRDPDPAGGAGGFRAEVNDLHQHLRGELNIGIINNLVTLPQMRITHAQRAQGAGTAGADQHRHDHPNEIELGVLDGHLHVGVVPLISPLSGLGTCRCMTSTRSSIAAAATHCSSARRRYRGGRGARRGRRGAQLPPARRSPGAPPGAEQQRQRLGP